MSPSLSRKILAASILTVIICGNLVSAKYASADPPSGQTPNFLQLANPNDSDELVWAGPGLYRATTRIVPFSKVVDGNQVKTKDITLICHPPGLERTRRLTYTVRAPINSWLCDEACSKPALNGIFIATFVVDRREHVEPKRGCLTGTWLIRNSLGHTTASGTMEGTVRAGTHDILTNVPPGDCEECDELYHFEGSLKGLAKAAPLAGHAGCHGRICATFQGTGLDPDRPVPGVTPFIENPGFVMRIEGAVFEPCRKIIFNPINVSLPKSQPERPVEQP